MERERSRGRDRERRSDKDRPRDRDRGRDRDRKEKDRDRDRKDKDRDRDRKDKERDRDRKDNKDRDRDRKKDETKDKDRDRATKDRDRDRKRKRDEKEDEDKKRAKTDGMVSKSNGLPISSAPVVSLADQMAALRKKKEEETAEKEKEEGDGRDEIGNPIEPGTGKTPPVGKGLPGSCFPNKVVSNPDKPRERDELDAIIDQMKEKEKETTFFEAPTLDANKTISLEDILKGDFTQFESMYGNVEVKPIVVIQDSTDYEKEKDSEKKEKSEENSKSVTTKTGDTPPKDRQEGDRAETDGEKADGEKAETGGEKAEGIVKKEGTDDKNESSDKKEEKSPRAKSEDKEKSGNREKSPDKENSPEKVTEIVKGTVLGVDDELGISFKVTKTKEEADKEDTYKSNFMASMAAFLGKKTTTENPALHDFQEEAKLEQNRDMEEDVDEIEAQIKIIEAKEIAERLKIEQDKENNKPDVYKQAITEGPHLPGKPKKNKNKASPYGDQGGAAGKDNAKSSSSTGGPSSSTALAVVPSGPKKQLSLQQRLQGKDIANMSYKELSELVESKKELPRVDHNKLTYVPIDKQVYRQAREITDMTEEEVKAFRKLHCDITVAGKGTHPRPVKTFAQCGLPKKIMAHLTSRGFEIPFPVQMQCLPILMNGRDCLCLAPTGSGKTLAFLLPMIRHVLAQPPVNYGKEGPIGLALSPTRELSMQIFAEAKKLCKEVDITVGSAIGGLPFGEQLGKARAGCDVMIGTPGRMVDLFATSNGKITNLYRVSYIVVDEADRMLDQGFGPVISDFFNKTQPKQKQVAMFSATFPDALRAIAAKYLKKPLMVKIGAEGTSGERIKQDIIITSVNDKFNAFLKVIGEWCQYSSIIVFVRDRNTADQLWGMLRKYSYASYICHGGMDQADRNSVIKDFKAGERDLMEQPNILIATGLVARGLDIPGCKCVINYVVPDSPEDYVHKIGRTGRAGKKGCAYTFVTPEDKEKAQMLIDLMNQSGQEIKDQRLFRLAQFHAVQVNSGEAQQIKTSSTYYGGRSFSMKKEELTENKRTMRAEMELAGHGDDRKRRKKEWQEGLEKAIKEDDEFVVPEPITAKHDPEKQMAEAKKGMPPPPASASREGNTDAAGESSDAAGTSDASAKPVDAADGDKPAEGSDSKASAPANAAVGAKAGGAIAKAGAVVVKAKGEASTAESAPAKAAPPAVMIAKVTPEEEAEIIVQAKATAQKIVDTMTSLSYEAKEKMYREKYEHAFKTLMSKKTKKTFSAPAGPKPQKMAPPAPVNPFHMPGNTLALIGSAKPKGPGTAQLFGPVPVKGTTKMVERRVDGTVFHYDCVEINDYPDLARMEISRKDFRDKIDELTGCRLLTKGIYIKPGQPNPSNERRLYVEIKGETEAKVASARRHVENAMEENSKRTLNLGRGLVQAGRRWDPMTGTMV